MYMYTSGIVLLHFLFVPSSSISYKESTDDENEGEGEEGEEDAGVLDGQTAPQEEDNREKIEKVSTQFEIMLLVGVNCP